MITDKSYGSCTSRCNHTGKRPAIIRSENDYQCITRSTHLTVGIWTGMLIYSDTGIIDPAKMETLSNFALKKGEGTYGEMTVWPSNATTDGPIYLQNGYYVLSSVTFQPNSGERFRCACQLGR